MRSRTVTLGFVVVSLAGILATSRTCSAQQIPDEMTPYAPWRLVRTVGVSPGLAEFVRESKDHTADSLVVLYNKTGFPGIWRATVGPTITLNVPPYGRFTVDRGGNGSDNRDVDGNEIPDFQEAVQFYHRVFETILGAKPSASGP